MILAVVVVAIVVGGATVAIVAMNNKGGESIKVGAALPVYGNANLDADINGDDLSIIEKIIAKDPGYTLVAYPFADANKDGQVTSADVDVVKKIMNKEKTKVYHLSYYNDGAVNVTTKVVSTNWPCEGLLVTYNSIMFMMTAIGVDDKCVGSTAVGSTYLDKYMYAKILENAEPLTSTYDSGMGVSNLDVSSVTAAMTKHSDAHTVFASAYGNYDTYNEDAIEAVGCDVVRFCESNPSRDETLASVLLMGFLTNKMDRAKELTKIYSDIWEEFGKITATLPDEDKVGFVVCASSTTACAGTNNQHNYKCVMAGGKSVLGADNADIGTWILEPAYNDNIDKIIYVAWSNGPNGYFFGNHEINSAKLIKDFTDNTNWTKTNAYKNKEVYYVYGDFPTAMNILARGYAMYPEYYGDLYNKSCDKLLSFISNGDFAGKGLKFVFSLSEMENY